MLMLRSRTELFVAVFLTTRRFAIEYHRFRRGRNKSTRSGDSDIVGLFEQRAVGFLAGRTPRPRTTWAELRIEHEVGRMAPRSFVRRWREQQARVECGGSRQHEQKWFFIQHVGGVAATRSSVSTSVSTSSRCVPDRACRRCPTERGQGCAAVVYRARRRCRRVASQEHERSHVRIERVGSARVGAGRTRAAVACRARRRCRRAAPHGHEPSHLVRARWQRPRGRELRSVSTTSSGG
jgi:hypothetical protein